MDRLLDEDEVEHVTKRKSSTLQKDRVAGRGIPFIKLGRLVRYRESDVAQYLAGCPTYRSTSEFTGDREPAGAASEAA